MQYHLAPADHPALHQSAAPIPPEEIASDHIQQLIADMKEILAGQELGVAIAAPQVGEALQLFIVSGKVFAIRESDENNAEEVPPDQVYINPRLVKTSQKKAEKHEGCLTMPGLWGMVPRAERATVTAFDESGKPFTRGASGLLAHIFQHEIDHLEGTLFTDKAVKLMRDEPSSAAAL